jgi:hypothetical protein
MIDIQIPSQGRSGARPNVGNRANGEFYYFEPVSSKVLEFNMLVKLRKVCIACHSVHFLGDRFLI